MVNAGSGRPLLVVCAGTPWEGVPGSDHQLSTELLRYVDILWVDPEVSMVTRDRRELVPRLDSPLPGLTRLTTVVLPLHTRAGVRLTTARLVRTQVRWALRRIGRRPHTVLECRLAGMLGGWGDGVRSVLYGTDDFVGAAQLWGVPAERIEADEAKALANADLVIAVSPTLAQRWQAMGARVEMIPNGVSADAYRDTERTGPANGVNLSAPIAGVIGQLTERIDIALLEEVVAAGVSLLLVGPVDPAWQSERVSRLLASPRVLAVGRQPFEALPGYLRRIDVGLTPYADSAFNRAAFPLKTLEYLAAGRAVVSTDLPATRWLDTDLVRVAGPGEFGRAVRDEASRPRSADLIAARQAFAAHHSWAQRARQVAELLGFKE